VLGIGREIRFGEKSPCRGETSGEIGLRGFFVSLLFQNPGETKKSLGRDCGGRAVHRFVFVERFCRAVQVVAQVGKAWGAGIPVRNAVGRRFVEIEVGGDAGDFEVAVEDFLFSSEILEFGFGQKLEEFVLLGETAENPGMTAGPGREGGVALLSGGATVGSVRDIEDRFMRDPTRNVVRVAALTVIDIVAGGGFRVLEGAVEKIDIRIVFSHEAVAQHMRKAEGAEGTDGVGEKRLGPVEGTDVTEFGGQLGPARGLDRPAGFEREVVEVGLPFVGKESTFAKKAAEVSVGADIVEAVIMDPDMGDVGGHAAECSLPANFEHRSVASGVVLEDGGAVDESFGPLGPAPRGVFAFNGEDGGAVRILPAFLEGEDFRSGCLENFFGGSFEAFWGESSVVFDHKIRVGAGGILRRGR